MGHDNCNQFPEIRTDVVDNQIDTLTKAFQGLTVSCARCHDHKIDPIPTEDYYALYGVLNSSRPVTRTIDLAGPDATNRERLTALKSHIRTAIASEWLRRSADLDRQLAAAIAWENDSPDGARNRSRSGRSLGSTNSGNCCSGRISILAIRFIPQSSGCGSQRRRSGRRSSPELRRRSREAGTIQLGKVCRFRRLSRTDFPPAGRRTAGATAPAVRRMEILPWRRKAATLLTGVFPAGIFTNLLSDRLNGVLRSPLLPRDKKYLTLQIAGSNLGAYRLILDHCVIGEDHQLLKNPNLSWVRTSSEIGSASACLSGDFHQERQSAAAGTAGEVQGSRPKSSSPRRTHSGE